MRIKVVNKSNNELPNYATIGSAAMDVRANINRILEGKKCDFIELGPMERKIIPTGLYFELPIGYELQIRPRSGLAIKNGITVINTPGTLDSDYRGELCILLVNLSDEWFTIFNGDRIAQILVKKYESIEWEQVDKLSETERGSGGFNSTGIK